MYSVYKKLTIQDISIVPFNAHKQYSFNSSSAALNKVKHFDTRWTSASIYSYTSGSSGGSASIDTHNILKYNQINHLFYDKFKVNINNRLGDTHYLNQKRALYSRANILSIPAGLFGHEIYPNTFYLSSSAHEVTDDSHGNLIISGTLDSDFNTDIRANILRIGPEKGFKQYDLNTRNGFEASLYYRRGKPIINGRTVYSTDFGVNYDDSYYFNNIKYNNITFSEITLRGGLYSGINFNGASEIQLANDEKFHFNPGDDFTITLWARVNNNLNNGSVYLISKSTTRTIIPSPISGKAAEYSTAVTGAAQTKDVAAANKYPFEVYIENVGTTPHVIFRRFDGNTTSTVSASFTTSSLQHVSCRVSSSQMEIFTSGIGSGISGSDNTFRETQNNANIYIGNKGGNEKFLNGILSQINIYDEALSDTQILNHYSSSNGSPYVGNIFYSTGIATITHPNYQTVLSGSMPHGTDSGSIHALRFQGSHLLYENEYQCTVEEHEFNNTMNISARKLRTTTCQDAANFVSSSIFKPYVTTVGLFNEEGECLVVGKLGQPVRTSDETDTTFILRWDT